MSNSGWLRDVAIFLPSLEGGGAERAMVTLANGFASRGQRVDLVLASAQGPYLAEVTADVRVVDLGTRGVVASLPGLVRYLRRERPYAMLSALNHANVIAVVARLLARTNTRLVISERSDVSRPLTQIKSLRARCVVPLMKWSYRRSDAITAVSSGVADDLARTIGLSRNRIEVIYNPVVTASMLVQANAPVDHPWVRVGQPPLVLAAGRLTPQKDFPTLIQAFAKVRMQRECRLVILGEGELRESLQALIHRLGLDESVQMPGFSENPFAWMRRASVFVLSSAWEGLPNVLIQAMACGTRVVSTDCPSGPQEILEGGRWGPLVSVGDVEAMGNAILAQLNCSSKSGAQERSAFFSVDNAVEGYLRLLRGNLKEREQ